MWSPSPYATAQSFKDLKPSEPEPDAEQAAAFGSDESSQEIDRIVDKLNSNNYDFLLKLPRITMRNIARIMKSEKNEGIN